MIVRVYRRGKQIVVAACDRELLGKTFKSGELRLHVSEQFYGEEFGGEERLLEALQSCTTANLVGRKTVELAIRAGFIDRAGVLYIDEVPHAQLFRF